MSYSFEQIKQATRKKPNGLFFIKSKHVPPTFHNHWYFQMNPPKNTKTQHSQYTQPQNTVESQTQVIKKWKMFVDEPKSYGIQNTFRYMCDRIRQSNKKNMVQLKKIQQKVQNSIQSNKTIPKQHVTIGSEKKRSRKNIHNRIKTQPNNKYLQTTESFNYRIKKSRYQPEELPTKNSETKLSKTTSQCQATHFIQMIYIGGRMSYYNDLSLQKKIIFNLLPYILNCFFKCKINYQKKLTQTQYNQIIRSIEEIKLNTKSYFDVKDIINLSTVQQVLQILQIYGQGTLEWIETIRYFFMPSEEILGYQFKKMEDQIKVMSILKFNAELNDGSVYIYRVQDKLKIENLYDMLKPGTYIYSQNKSVYEVYCSILKRKADLFSYKNRISKWRSIAPLDQSSTKNQSISSQRGSSQVIAKAQKYQKLYELSKKRRKKNQRASIVSNINLNSSSNGILITHNSNNSFIDRTKLQHVEDIFQ